MNSVQLIGRLTRDPEVRYTGDQMAIATFSIAIDRPPRRDGTKETDFPRITVFGRQAENCEKYLVKGRLVGIEGRIQTGSYTNRNGDKVYTTDVVANRVEFLEWGDRQGSGRSYGGNDFGGSNDFGGNDFGGPSQGGFAQNSQSSLGGGSNFGGNDFGSQRQNDFGGQSQSGFGAQSSSDFGRNDFGGPSQQAPQQGFSQAPSQSPAQSQDQIPTGFAPLEEDDIPF